MQRYNRIRIVLAERDITRTWLADQLGIHKGTVSKWCANLTQPSLITLYQVAEILDIEVRLLLHPTKKGTPLYDDVDG